MSELTVGSLKGLSANNFKIEVASGSQLVQPGSILQVVSTTKTDPFFSTTLSYVDVTGLSATITPSSASSKILVLATTNVSSDVDGLVRLVRNTTPIGNGSGGSLIDGFGQVSIQVVNFVVGYAINHLDSPATTSATTYKIQARPASTGTVWINRRNAGAQYYLSSSLTLMEVAG